MSSEKGIWSQYFWELLRRWSLNHTWEFLNVTNGSLSSSQVIILQFKKGNSNSTPVLYSCGLHHFNCNEDTLATPSIQSREHLMQLVMGVMKDLRCQIAMKKSEKQQHREVTITPRGTGRIWWSHIPGRVYPKELVTHSGFGQQDKEPWRGHHCYWRPT